MFAKAKNGNTLTVLSLLSVVSIFVLSTKLETHALINTDLNHATTEQKQVDYLIAKDEDHDKDRDEDRDEDSGDYVSRESSQTLIAYSITA